MLRACVHADGAFHREEIALGMKLIHSFQIQSDQNSREAAEALSH